MSSEINKEEEKELLLLSESFPLDEKNERKKMKPVAEVHTLLKGVTIDKEKIFYKAIGLDDYEEVKKLHKEWFPVPYNEEFYENIFKKNNGQYDTVGAYYPLDIGEGKIKNVLLGLIIIQWRYVNKYFFDIVGKEVSEEINRSIDYEEEISFLFTKYPSYFCLYVMTLGVIDECRKMNIGTKLLKSVLNYGINVPYCLGVYLNVIENNFSGIKFYEKNGMTKTKHLTDFYEIDGKKYNSESFVMIYSREQKNKARSYRFSQMKWYRKLYKILILKPFYFLVKILLMIFLCRWFSKKVKTD